MDSMFTETFSVGFAVILGIGCSASLAGLVLLKIWTQIPAPVPGRAK
jgi:hypothetical protein